MIDEVDVRRCDEKANRGRGAAICAMGEAWGDEGPGTAIETSSQKSELCELPPRTAAKPKLGGECCLDHEEAPD